jgi:hypothetical protein
MKKVLKITLLLLVLAACYPVIWIAASKGLFGEIEFGYFKELHIAKHAIEKSGCVTIEQQMANPDNVLEEIFFDLSTPSGRVVSLYFDASNMDVEQVCYQPTGLAVSFNSGAKDLPEQAYSIESLSHLLKEKELKVTNLKDVLCNIDELEQLFKAHQTNIDIPRIAYLDSRKHLHIHFEDK